MKKFLLVTFILWLALSVKAQSISMSDAGKLMAETFKELNNGEAKGNNEAVIVSAYTDPQTGLQFINLKQSYKGIRVLNAVQTNVFRKDVLQSSVSTFIQNIETKAPDAGASVTAPDAVIQAARHLGLSFPVNMIQLEDRFTIEKKMIFSSAGIAKQNIETELVWVSGDDSAIHLAWSITIDVKNSADHWNVKVDAYTGIVINKSNYTRYDNFDLKTDKKFMQNTMHENIKKEASPAVTSLFNPLPSPPPTVTSATYNVVPFPFENRFSGNVSIDTDPWKKAGAGNNATTHGWHFDGTTNYNYTRGNNVYAYDDSLAINTPGRSDTSSTAGNTLTFNNTPDFTLQPTARTNRLFATDNLFYWNNIMHDVFYQYGFNESAGNFQKDNLNRGPFMGVTATATAGNDAVQANAQDGGGLSNANFNTPPDGQAPRMQMYLFSAANSNILSVSAPLSLKGTFAAVENAFNSPNKLVKVGPVTGDLVMFKDDNSGTVNFGCNAPVNNISGKIAVIIRGGPCSMFVNKVKNAQSAGAIAVIIVDNGNGVGTMGGTDNTITIPAIMISATDGTALKNALNANMVVTATFHVATQFDGDLDNGVIAHEYGHGISNRLTGGYAGSASCLANNEEGGEGWSDYMALMVTTDWTKAKLTDGSIPRPIGTYVVGQTAGSTSGIRTYPYTTNMFVNPQKYGNVSRNTEFPQTDGNGNIIPNATEVHYIGEIWCSAIWDMTWAIIQQEGSINPDIYDVAGGGGNVKALQLVMTGMKLQPCSPGFLDARNAILKADSILFNYAHKCAIWSAFAKRGMGYSAVQGSSNSTTDQVEKFDVPGLVTTNVNISNAPLGGVCSGVNFTFTATPVNGGTLPQYQWTRNGINEPGATSTTFTSKFVNNDAIRCILTSNIGCAANISSTSSAVIVPVNPSPVVSVTASGVLSFCSGDSVVLTSATTTGNQWYFNGALVNVPNNSILIAKASGLYTDTLTGSNGCRGGSSPVTVTVNALPVTPVISTSTSPALCQGDSVVITSSVATGNQWYKNGSIITGAINTTYTTGIAGVYTDTIKNAAGCKAASIATTVVVSALPATPTITYGSATIFCDGDSVILTSSAATGNQWYRNGVAISNATATKDTAKLGGVYTLKASNTSGCAVVSNAILVGVNMAPAVSVTAASATNFCTGGSVVLTAAGGGIGYAYQWQKDAVNISLSTATSYTTGAGGVYTVLVTHPNGCKKVSAGTVVTVDAYPAVPGISAAGSTSFCANKNVVLSSSAAAGNQWYKDAIAITGATNKTFTANLSGNYTVIATTAAGCATASTVTTLTANALPAVPTIAAAGPTTFCSGSSVLLTASTGAGYQWYKDGTTITGAAGATHTATASGAYTVEISNASGCTNTSAAINITATVVATPAIIQMSDSLVSNAAGGNQWYLNNTALTGSINQKHKILNTGSYTVRVTDVNGCQSAFSIPLAVVITATSNVTLNSKEWTVFPNPVTNGRLFIHKNGTLNGAATAQVFSLDGKALAEKKIGAHTEWDINRIPSGAYYLRITENKMIAVYAFIKQ
jgi:hypothetical protein